jgi:alpha-tubulin suppressor-like RCC1 family protein
VYNGYCNADTPYPSVSHESVPSLIDNLVNALYGAITKDVSSGKVVWNIPCDPNNTTQIANIPRLENEGLLCYIIRVLDSVIGGGSAVNPAVSSYNLAGGAAWSLPYQSGVGATSFLSIGASNQVLSINSSGQIVWGNAVSTNTASSVVRRDASGNFAAGTITANLVGNVSGNALTATTATTATTAVNATTATNATNATYATTAGSASTATTATNATTATTATAVVSGGVLTSMIGDAQVTGTKLETLSGLVAGTYGSAAKTPSLTIDTKGRITAISEISQPTKTIVAFFADSSYGDVGYTAFNAAGILVDSNNLVRTIGTNNRYRLGQGIDNQNSTGIGFFVAQVPKASNETITKVMVTYGSMFALSDLGNIYSCGANGAGVLGVGDTTDRYAFTKITGVSNVVDFCVSTSGNDSDAYHALAITSSGALYAWGSNSYGQLGDGTTTNRPTPTLITSGAISGKTLTRCFAFGGGVSYSFVLDNNNNIYCTGANFYGELGLGDTTNRSSFVQVSTLKASSVYASPAVNTTYYQASTYIVWQGGVWATGRNAYGQLGVGDTIDKSSFTAISGLSNVSSLTMSNQYANAGTSVAALLADGTIRTWGRGTEGALGTGSNSNASTPQTLSGVSGLTFSKIQLFGDTNSGGANLVALTTGGVIYVCGYQGRIYGDGGSVTTNRNVLQPVRQPVAITFTDFRVYGLGPNPLVYAKSSTGELWSWGFNNVWQTSTSYGTQVSLPQKAFLN